MSDERSVLEVRIGDEDRERYGGPEWLPLDLSELMSRPMIEQSALEQQMTDNGGISLFRLRYGDEWREEKAVVRISLPWLARQQAGLTEPRLADFRIDHGQIAIRVQRGPAVPLDEDSPTPGETTPEPSPPSPETALSTRRSRSSSRR